MDSGFYLLLRRVPVATIPGNHLGTNFTQVLAGCNKHDR